MFAGFRYSATYLVRSNWRVQSTDSQLNSAKLKLYYSNSFIRARHWVKAANLAWLVVAVVVVSEQTSDSKAAYVFSGGCVGDNRACG